MMCPAIDNATSYEIRAAIPILPAKNAVYGQNSLSKATERQWCTVYKDDWANRRSG
jgi:hypothetical protein